MVLSAKNIACIRKTLHKFTDDEDFNNVIKYRRNISEDYYDPETQRTDNQYVDTLNINSLRTDVSDIEVERMDDIQVGDTKHVFDRVLVEGVLSTKDVIVESGVTYNILKIRTDTLGVTAICFGRKLSEAD